MFFGKGTAPSHHLSLKGNEILWDAKCSYPGVSFGCCVKETLAKLYRSLYAIIQIGGRSDEMVMLRLLATHCLPILSYATEVIVVSNRDDKRQLRVAYNSIYRKMFGYSYRESVTLLQHTLGRLTWEELLEDKKKSFLTRCKKNPVNPVIHYFCTN